jgi:hypothetical protein
MRLLRRIRRIGRTASMLVLIWVALGGLLRPCCLPSLMREAAPASCQACHQSPAPIGEEPVAWCVNALDVLPAETTQLAPVALSALDAPTSGVASNVEAHLVRHCLPQDTGPPCMPPPGTTGALRAPPV